MTKIFVYSHNSVSGGAKRLSALVGKRVRHQGSRFRPSPNKVLVNWGASELPNGYAVCRVLNSPASVNEVSNKLTFYQIMADSPLVPEWTTNADVAQGWLEGGVMCRTMLRGSGGRGCVYATTPAEFVDAPLYTRYVKKKDEYRVHIFDNQVIDIQRKAKRNGFENANFQIRNHDNGFIYMRDGIDPPHAVTQSASDTMLRFHGLTFGAVDVIYNTHQERAYVLEINTAPGLEGTTVENYARAIKESVI